VQIPGKDHQFYSGAQRFKNGDLQLVIVHIKDKAALVILFGGYVCKRIGQPLQFQFLEPDTESCSGKAGGFANVIQNVLPDVFVVIH
jgi:hypothetical protein